MRFRFTISLAAAAVWAAAQIAALPVLARAHDDEGDEESDAQWVARTSESDHYNQGITHREVRRLNFHPGRGVIEVDGGENGGAMVRGGSATELEAVARIETHGRTSARAEDLARQVQIIQTGNLLHPEGPAGHGSEHWQVIFRLVVPHRSDLKLDARNGPLAVSGVLGRMELHAQNGPLALSSIGGDVFARLQNGPVSVDLDGRSWEGRGLDVACVNGPLNLELPRSYSCELETGTVNGPIDLGLTGEVQQHGGRVRMHMGSGGARVRVVTTNGPARIATHR